MKDENETKIVTNRDDIIEYLLEIQNERVNEADLVEFYINAKRDELKSMHDKELLEMANEFGYEN